jgi:hypothetical protein
MIFPSLPKFAKAMLHVVLWAAQGRPVIAPERTQSLRRQTCHTCPHRVGEQCQICTCFIGVKVMLSSESCPKGYWKTLTLLSKPVTKNPNG